MVRLFGTDGIRGTTEFDGRGDELRLTPELALRIGHAAGWLARERLAARSSPRAILGRDPRISGMMLENALTAGLLAQGIEVVQAGVVPTPAVAFLARQAQAALGIVISASHNPVSDNGIKFFGRDGYKLADALEEEIESLVLDPGTALGPLSTRRLGCWASDPKLQGSYADFLAGSWQGNRDLSGFSVLLECANGATSSLAPELFRRLGARVEVSNGVPDGLNINESYEYVEPRRLGEAVRNGRFDLGIAFDGDGDRVILVDEQGDAVDGDAIMVIAARRLAEQGRLANRIVVATTMSNYGLHDSLREIDARVVETRVGDRYVLQQMLATGSVLGGERSGHIIMRDRGHTTGDGLYTAVFVAGILADRPGHRLSELASQVRRYPQFIESAAIPPTRPRLEDIPHVQAILERLESQLGSAVEVNVRYSGTENKLRLSVRSRTQADAGQIAEAARAALQQMAQAIWAHETGTA